MSPHLFHYICDIFGALHCIFGYLRLVSDCEAVWPPFHGLSRAPTGWQICAWCTYKFWAGSIFQGNVFVMCYLEIWTCNFSFIYTIICSSSMQHATFISVKLSLCFNWAPRREGVLGEWRYITTYYLISAQDGGEWSASRSSHITFRERAPGSHWIGSWVGPRAGLDVVVKRKIPRFCRDSNPPVIQSVAQRYTTELFRLLSVQIVTKYISTASRSSLGPTQPPIQWVLGALCLGIKRRGREADDSPPPSAEVKEWLELYLHSPWRGAQLRKAQGQLYITFTISMNIFLFTK
jgi:hypothetical protein